MAIIGKAARLATSVRRDGCMARLQAANSSETNLANQHFSAPIKRKAPAHGRGLNLSPRCGQVAVWLLGLDVVGDGPRVSLSGLRTVSL